MKARFIQLTDDKIINAEHVEAVIRKEAPRIAGMILWEFWLIGGEKLTVADDDVLKSACSIFGLPR
jgi:hypothetical protein